MSDQTTENNAYSETPDLRPTVIATKNRKRLLIAIVIICVIVPPYAFFTFLGFIAYPKWYLVGSFYLNRDSFEYVKDSGENFCADTYGSYNLDEYEDPKLAISIKNITQNCRFGEAYWKQNEEVLMFRPYNYTGGGNTRGILYSENEIDQFDDFYYRCKCKSLGDGWYYYYAYRKGSYYDEG